MSLLLILLVGSTLLVSLALQMAKNVVLAWNSFLILVLMGIALGFSQNVVGGLHLSPFDLWTASVLLAGMIRFYNRRHLPGTVRMVILTFISIFVFSIVRGMLIYGFVTASADARGLITEIIAMLYFTTVPTDMVTIRKIVRSLLWFGLGLAVIAALRYAGLDFGTAGNEDFEKNRVLPADAANNLAICFFLSLGWLSHRVAPAYVRFCPPLFAGFAVILQHRSVWNVLIVGSVTLLFLDLRMLKRFAPAAVITGIVVIVSALGVYGNRERASLEFQDSATNTGTLEWRTTAWNQLVFDKDQTPLTILLGKAAATPTTFIVNGSFVTAPPHSEYVTLYLRTGIIGILCYLYFILRPVFLLISRQRRSPLSLFPSPSAWCIFLIGIAIFGITYTVDGAALMLAGVVNAMVLGSEEAQVEDGNHFAPVNRGTAYASLS